MCAGPCGGNRPDAPPQGGRPRTRGLLPCPLVERPHPGAPEGRDAGPRPEGGDTHRMTALSTPVPTDPAAHSGAAPVGTDDRATALSVRDVYKVFGRRPVEAIRRLEQGASRDDVKPLGTAAVIDASFDVKQGEIFVVMGLSGSGKSTLIRMLNGLWKPTSGHVLLGGTDLAQADAKQMRALRRKHVSMVFQHFALLPHRTVLDNAAYPWRSRASARRSAARRPAPRSASSGSAGGRTPCPRSSPAACASASGSPARSPPTPTSCSWTRRSPRSTRSSGARCRSSSSSSSRRSARRSSSSRTTSTRRCTSATGSPSCATAGSCRSAPPSRSCPTPRTTTSPSSSPTWTARASSRRRPSWSAPPSSSRSPAVPARRAAPCARRRCRPRTSSTASAACRASCATRTRSRP